MTFSGPWWALSVASYFHAFPSFDSCAVGDHFRVAVAVKTCETDPVTQQ